MRTWTLLALVLASLVACLPRQAVAAVMQAIRDGEALASGSAGRRGSLGPETLLLPGISAMKIESGDGDGDEHESPDSTACRALPGMTARKSPSAGSAIARRAEHSPDSLKERTLVRRC